MQPPAFQHPETAFILLCVWTSTNTQKAEYKYEVTEDKTKQNKVMSSGGNR